MYKHLLFFFNSKYAKKNYTADGEVIRRMTFTNEEWRKFYLAMDDIYTAKKHTNGLTDEQIFERQLVRHYFLFAANSGLRSSELRKLQWHNISTYKDKTQNGEELIFANLYVDRSTSKVRKGRRVIAEVGNILSVGNVYVRSRKELEGVFLV